MHAAIANALADAELAGRPGWVVATLAWEFFVQGARVQSQLWPVIKFGTGVSGVTLQAQPEVTQL